MQRRSLLLLGLWLALILGDVVSARASQTVWSGLVIANNVAQPDPVPAELTRMESTLKELFGYNQFKVIGQSRKSLVTGSEDWMAQSKYFSLHVDSKEGSDKTGYLLDLKSGKATNVTGALRVSHFNEGLRFVPGDPTRLRFSAMIGGKTRAYLVDRDGKNKRELSKDYPHLVHGMSLSPDGKRGAYEDPAYRLFLADADSSNAKEVKTGQRFHLVPTWSPDGAWVLFVAGEHYDCHPHVVKADGTGLKKLASRNGYRGVIDFLDVYDFHGGSSDLPVWAPDSMSVFYTAKVGKNVELFRVTLDGKSEQLTDTAAGSMHYHPVPSPDGKWLVYGSKREGVRQLYLMRLSDRKEHRITDLKKGQAAMWPSWQPRAALTHRRLTNALS